MAMRAFEQLHVKRFSAEYISHNEIEISHNERNGEQRAQNLVFRVYSKTVNRDVFVVPFLFFVSLCETST